MSSIIEQVQEGIWKLSADGNVYFLDFEEKIIIDTSARANRRLLEQFLSKVVDFDKVVKVLLTHLHFDHVGNVDLFPNAKVYASNEAIHSLFEDPNGTVLMEDIAQRLKKVKLHTLPEKIAGLEVIPTPGHTKGGVCFWYPSEKILFSGDTLFFNKNIGRLDLPTSLPEKMQETIIHLLKYNYKTLCPGHDY